MEQKTIFLKGQKDLLENLIAEKAAINFLKRIFNYCIVREDKITSQYSYEINKIDIYNDFIDFINKIPSSEGCIALKKQYLKNSIKLFRKALKNLKKHT